MSSLHPSMGASIRFISGGCRGASKGCNDHWNEASLYRSGRKDACRNRMPSPHYTSLLRAKCAFDGAGVNASVDVNPSPVFDRLMLWERPGPRERAKLIGQDRLCVLRDVLADARRQRAGPHIIGMKRRRSPSSWRMPTTTLFLRWRRPGPCW